MINREHEPELMDDPELPVKEHLSALRGLARLNWFSGVSGILYRRIRGIARSRPGHRIRVLDIASGSGDLPIDWAKRARKDSFAIDISTVDISATAIDEQTAAAQKAGVSINAIQLDCLEHKLPTGFDIVTCSLFMHHLNRNQAFHLLRSMQLASDSSILVCDLERSRLNLALVSVAARLLSRSYVVHHDSAVSVRSAFTMPEFADIAKEALARPVHLQRLHPCRFLMTLDEEMVIESVADPALAFA